MKPNQVATLVLRLMGIYCLVEAVPMFGMFGDVAFYARRAHLGPAGLLEMLAGSLLPATAMLMCGVLLLGFSTALAEKLTPKETDEAASTTAITLEQVQTLAFAVAGVVIFAFALPRLPNSIFFFLEWINRPEDYGQGSMLPIAFSEATVAAGTIVKALLGLVLFFRAQGFANFWRRLRTAGTPSPPSPPMN